MSFGSTEAPVVRQENRRLLKLCKAKNNYRFSMVFPKEINIQPSATFIFHLLEASMNSFSLIVSSELSMFT